ncbi:Methyltransferase domain-containing protein [Sulfidibacter corallicola]|uniref:Methyltransferase domain-containing protein n=1 Tax=Sulfidibacter corallicola TaxID=2818388 RepID=A0A8A4TXG0_SULCO|nr:methyltransferase domain-containing protein [Sulfidibacter corallicola]QTD51205.1 methyltransferase domain-containing protein [Sulfidibacter corallicola]
MREDSYVISTVARELNAEIDRLAAQVDLFWEQEAAFHTKAGLDEALSLVEFGSGPGYYSARLMERFPDLNLTCIEIDKVLTDHAEAMLAQCGFNQVQVRTDSITANRLPDLSYDASLARLLIEHLADPLEGLQEMQRILKPNGLAIVIDNDFSLHTLTYPEIPELAELFEAYCASRRSQGGSPRIGRRLPNLLEEAGFVDIHFDIVVAHNALTGDDIFLASEGVGIPAKLVEEGYLCSKTLATISRKWRDMLQSRPHTIMRKLCIASGRKPE